MTTDFKDALKNRILVFDGGMGTQIHTFDLPLSDYNGLENCSEVLNLTRPDVIEEIHRRYLEAGADIDIKDVISAKSCRICVGTL